MDNPNSVQFGGDHYIRAGHAQHWDLLPALGYGWEYFTGRATAYLTRIKDPLLDPSKAGHFIDKMVWLIEHSQLPGTFVPTRTTGLDLGVFLSKHYFPANAIIPGSLEAKAIKAILSARTLEDLIAAREILSQLEAGVSASSGAEPDMFVGDPLAPQPTGEGWPFSRGYVDQDHEKPATAEAEKDNRTFVFGDSAIAATSRPEEPPTGDKSGNN